MRVSGDIWPTGLSADRRELLRIRAGHAGAACDILYFPSLCPVPLGSPSPSFSYHTTFPDHLGNVVLEKSQPVIIMLESWRSNVSVILLRLCFFANRQKLPLLLRPKFDDSTKEANSDIAIDYVGIKNATRFINITKVEKYMLFFCIVYIV